MRVVLDLNIILDVLLARKQFLESAEVLILAEEGQLDAVLPLHAVSTIYYFCRKEMSDAAARTQLAKLLEIVEVQSIDSNGLKVAIASPIADFEDAIVAETAVAAHADFIITRNTRDYSHSVVSAITPQDFIARYFPISQ